MKGSRILVTGANSGLGKHCMKVFGAMPWVRETNAQQLLEMGYAEPFDAIIHCAYNTKPFVDTNQLTGYLDDTLLLTQTALSIPHRQFIFISTVDVYQKDGFTHHEDEVIRLHELNNFYAISKLMSEALVHRRGTNPLILRPSAMLGKYSKPNSLIKILTQDSPVLTLSKESTFNYIFHDDVSDFIQLALTQELNGIYNLTASTSVQLQDVVDHFKRKAVFGQYRYETSNADNQKISALLPNYKRGSMENITLYLNSLAEKEVVET